MRRLTVLTALLAVALPARSSAQPASRPYSGQHTRDVKALSAQEVRGYLAGDGLGMAKAGELNHYPGPKHVLAMADVLSLSRQQKSRIEAIYERMRTSAVRLGREVVDAEGALDRAFAKGTIDDAKLRAETSRIGALQGRLRAVHLSAHLATRKVLTHEQLAAYDRIRGYAAPPGTMHPHGS